MTERYNGWTNYETWCANLWFESDYWDDVAQEVMREEDNDRDAARHELAQRMEDMCEEEMPAVAGMYADLLNASLSSINWHEIAGHYIDNVEVEDIDEVEE